MIMNIWWLVFLSSSVLVGNIKSIRSKSSQARGGSETKYAYVYLNGSTLQLVPDSINKNQAIAYAVYDGTVNENGWKVLNVVAGYGSVGDASDEQIMTAAGMLEGYLTQLDIFVMYKNMFNASFGDKMDTYPPVKEFYEQQREWMYKMVSTESAKSDYWYYISLLLNQFDGLQSGYKMAAPSMQQLEQFAFDFLSGNGDYLDIRYIVSPDERPNINKMTKEQLLSILRDGHCSALIKLLPGYENVFAAHSSWYMYSAMNRIYKHYQFKLSSQNGRNMIPVCTSMSFSSYPGYLSSLDDFYIMNSGLVMLQTTNSIFDHTLYDKSTSHALLAWHRVRLANWLASSGQEWASIVSQYNSGTYNNQYMVLDLKMLNLSESVQDGALWVVEQIPGFVESGDQTRILQSGYWASYNVPFYETVFNMSGYGAAVAKHGTEFSHELCPRAKIFRRDQSNVVDIDSMKFIMRYNKYKNDPYSKGNPMNAICSRGDLMSPPSSGGCIDTKVTDYEMAHQQKAYIINGPTHQGLPPFSWSTSGLTAPHVGQPDVFNFTFITTQPVMT